MPPLAETTTTSHHSSTYNVRLAEVAAHLHMGMSIYENKKEHESMKNK
jgi:hypothetical protein